MPRNIYKVEKQISKKRGQHFSLHESSRDAKRLRRAVAREDKLVRAAAEMMKRRRYYAERVVFFQHCVLEPSIPFSEGDIVQLVARYLNRHHPELERLQQDRRKGRPPTNREELLKQRAEMEVKEFLSGLWMPEMGQEENLRKLKAWNGDWSSMSNIMFIRLTRDGVKQQSNFPPKGSS